jgi:hypothetical protein
MVLIASLRKAILLQMDKSAAREVSVIFETQPSANFSAVRSVIVQKKSPDECGAKYREETAPEWGQLHDKRGSDQLQRMKSVVHNNSSNSLAHGDHSIRTVTQSVAPQSHFRGICCFQQHHTDHPDGLCYQDYPRNLAAGGFMQRCHACNRQFGLIRHRWWGYHFCKKTCLNDFLAKRAQQIGRMKDWLSSSEAPAREPSRL